MKPARTDGRFRPAGFRMRVLVAMMLVITALTTIVIVLAERTLFLASIGAMLVVAGLIAGVMRDNAASVRPAVTRLIYGLLAVAVGLGASRSWSRYHVWRTQLGLWTQTVIDAPDSYRAWVALGSMMQRREVRPMGLRFTERAMAIYPSAAVLFGLAEGYQGSNHCDLAIPHFQHALRLRDDALTSRSRGNVAGGALKQGHPQLIFQLAHGHR